MNLHVIYSSAKLQVASEILVRPVELSNILVWFVIVYEIGAHSYQYRTLVTSIFFYSL